MLGDSCTVCGGDGQMSNAFGNTTRCPACHGTGRRNDEGGLRDVTKTKPSHYGPRPTKSAAAEQPSGPSTAEGAKLAAEVGASAALSEDSKAKLVREIVEYEASHGRCTQTFTKKVRRRLNGLAP